MNLIGSVEGKTAILVDDMVDTAGLWQKVPGLWRNLGQRDLCLLYASGSYWSGLKRIAQSDITELVVTNTIPLPPAKKHPKIKVLSVAPILAETVLRIFNDWSVSQLFEK